jgi:outer membrane scaffolding protein for murein synthesis (MipA/OmpV family)
MGRIDGAATLDLSASRSVGNLVLSADVTRWLATNSFTTLEVGAEYTMALSDRLAVVVATHGTWMDAAYAQSWFGVSDSQSAASGFSRYDASAGIKSIRTDLAAAYALTPRWALIASVSGSLLPGDARRSPVVQTRRSITTTLGFTYRFH